MSRIGRTILLVIVVIVVVLIAWVAYLFFSPVSGSGPVGTATTTTATTTSALTPDESAVSAAVTGFGAEEQLVSLLAPDASTTIAADYGSYVTPTLLAQWEANPQNAPGRVASSPWPDHITVGTITKTSTGYEVDATLVLMSQSSVTNGGNDGTDPLIIDLVQQNGTWLISKYVDQSEG